MVCEAEATAAAEGANGVGMFMIMIFSSVWLVLSCALTPMMYCPGATCPVTSSELPWKVSPGGSPVAVKVTGDLALVTVNWYPCCPIDR